MGSEVVAMVQVWGPAVELVASVTVIERRSPGAVEVPLLSLSETVAPPFVIVAEVLTKLLVVVVLRTVKLVLPRTNVPAGAFSVIVCGEASPPVELVVNAVV